MALAFLAAQRKDARNAKSAMQHRHFATVAAIIATLQLKEPALSHVIRHFTDELAGTNERFDRARFIAACRKEASP
jgi:hypothetical protein